MELDPKWKKLLNAWNRRRIENGALADLASTTEGDLRCDQIPRLADAPLSVVDEFDAMLERVGLDTRTNPMKAEVRIDLYLHCTECSARPACRTWLSDGEDRFGYRGFCLNAPMFERLLRVNSWRGFDPS
jgi:hypothetical protein